jgi:Spy/CpxP family protein refolding chaperone
MSLHSLAVNVAQSAVVLSGKSAMKLSRILGGLLLPLVALVLCVPPSASAQGSKWWQDEGYRRELGLTPEQRTRLEEIFQKSLPALRKQKETLDRAQSEFDRLVERGDDASVLEQVNSVETARAELNKLRISMLLRMRRSLTTDQWAKFTALHERDRGEQSPGTKRP